MKKSILFFLLLIVAFPNDAYAVQVKESMRKNISEMKIKKKALPVKKEDSRDYFGSSVSRRRNVFTNYSQNSAMKTQ